MAHAACDFTKLTDIDVPLFLIHTYCHAGCDNQNTKCLSLYLIKILATGICENLCKQKLCILIAIISCINKSEKKYSYNESQRDALFLEFIW
jgi:hypothetical protein